MTLVTEALDRIARQCSVKGPTSWLSATRADHVELRDDFLVETVEDILDRVDLGEPIVKTSTITGTGAENYALPSDFRRLTRDPLAIYDDQQDRAGVPVTNSGEWTYIKDLGTAGITRFFRVKGYEGNYTIDIYREPDTGETISVHYVGDAWITNGGTEKREFTDPEDTLLLPRRLVEAGTVWRFRERRGLPYQDKFNEYEALLQRAHIDSRNLRRISFGEPDRTIKWQDLVPAFIPDS